MSAANAPCRSVASSADELYDHLTAAHVGRKSTNNLCLTCHWEGCGVSCAKRDHITSHLRVHTNLKPHACVICRKQFKRPQDLKKHEKIHTEEHHQVHRHSKATMVNAEGEAVQPPRYVGGSSGGGGGGGGASGSNSGRARGGSSSSSSKGYGKSKVPLTGKTTMKYATSGPPAAGAGRKNSFGGASSSSRRSNNDAALSDGSESEGYRPQGLPPPGMGRKRNSDGDLVPRDRTNSVGSSAGGSMSASMSPRQFGSHAAFPPAYPPFAHHHHHHHGHSPAFGGGVHGSASPLYPSMPGSATDLYGQAQAAAAAAAAASNNRPGASVNYNISVSVPPSVAERHRIEYERLCEQQKLELLRFAQQPITGTDPHTASGYHLHRSLSVQNGESGEASHHGGGLGSSSLGGDHTSSSTSRYGTSLPTDSGMYAIDQLYADVKKRKVEPVYDASMAAKLDELAQSLSAFPSGSGSTLYPHQQHPFVPSRSSSGDALNGSAFGGGPSSGLPDIKSTNDLAVFNKFMLSLGENAQGQSHANGTTSLFDATTLAQLGLTGMPGMPGSATSNDFESPAPTKYESPSMYHASPTEPVHRHRSSSHGSHTSSVADSSRPIAGMPLYGHRNNANNSDAPLNSNSVYPTLPNAFQPSPSTSHFNFDAASSSQQGNAGDNFASFDSLAKPRASMPAARLESMDYSQPTYRSHHLLGSARPHLSSPARSSTKNSLDVLVEACEELRERDDGSSTPMILTDEPMEIDGDDLPPARDASNVSPPLPHGKLTDAEAGPRYKLPALRSITGSPAMYPDLPSFRDSVDEDMEVRPSRQLPGVAALLDGHSLAPRRHAKLIMDILVQVNRSWRDAHGQVVKSEA